MPRSATPKKAEAAMALRLAGASAQEVAEVLGFASPAHVERAITDSLAATVDSAGREQMRELGVRRLERLLRGIWNKAVSSTIELDEKTFPNPDQLVAVREARALIHEIGIWQGAMAPTEVSVSSPTQAALEKWVAQVRAIEAPSVEELDVLADVMDAEVVEEN